MAYNSNYGQGQPPEYNSTYGGDSTNGTYGSQTPQSVRNAAVQSKGGGSGNGADLFMQAAERWHNTLKPQPQPQYQQQEPAFGGGANPYVGQQPPPYSISDPERNNVANMPPPITHYGGQSRIRPIQQPPPQQGNPILTGTSDLPPSPWDLIGIPNTEWGPYAPQQPPPAPPQGNVASIFDAVLNGGQQAPINVNDMTMDPNAKRPVKDLTKRRKIVRSFDSDPMGGVGGLTMNPNAIVSGGMNNSDPVAQPVGQDTVTQDTETRTDTMGPGTAPPRNVPLPSELGFGGYTSGWESYENPWTPPAAQGGKVAGSVPGGMNNTDPTATPLPQRGAGYTPTTGTAGDAFAALFGGGGKTATSVPGAMNNTDPSARPLKVAGQTQSGGALPKPSFWDDATMGSWDAFQQSALGQSQMGGKDLTMNNGDPTPVTPPPAQTPMDSFDQWVAQQRERETQRHEQELIDKQNGGGTSTGTGGGSSSGSSGGSSGGTGTYTSTTTPLGGMVDPSQFQNPYLAGLEEQLRGAWDRQGSEAFRSLRAQGALSGVQDSGAWANANADLANQLASSRANQLTPMLFEGGENAQQRALQAALGNLDATTSITNARTQAGAQKYGARQAADASRYGSKLGYDAQTSGNWLNYLLGNAGISQRDREALLNYNLGNRRIDSDVYGMDQRDRQYWATLLQQMGPEQLVAMLLGNSGQYAPYPVVK